MWYHPATRAEPKFKPGDTVWYFTTFVTPERKRTYWTDSQGKNHTRYVTKSITSGYWEPGAVVLAQDGEHYTIQVHEWCGKTCRWVSLERRVLEAHLRRS